MRSLGIKITNRRVHIAPEGEFSREEAIRLVTAILVRMAGNDRDRGGVNRRVYRFVRQMAKP